MNIAVVVSAEYITIRHYRKITTIILASWADVLASAVKEFITINIGGKTMYKILYQTLMSTKEGKKVVSENYSPATFTKDKIQHAKRLNKRIGYRLIGQTRHNGKHYHTWERVSYTESNGVEQDVYYRIMYIKVK